MKNFIMFVLFFSTCYHTFSQSTFESKFCVDEDSEFRFAVETSDNDFMLLTHVSGKNDCIVKVSSEGDSISVLNYSVPEGNLVFFGVFNHPTYNDIFIAPAVIDDKGACNTVALLYFNSDLVVIDIKKNSFENVNFSRLQIPIPVIRGDEIIFTALVRLPDARYAHLFANINIDGNIIGSHIYISPDYEYGELCYPSDFIILCDNPIQYSYCHFIDVPVGTNGYCERKLIITILDSDFIVQESKELDSFYGYDIEYDSYNFLTFLDLPKLRMLNDSVMILQIMARDFDEYGIAYLYFDVNLDIIKHNFIINNNTQQRLPLINSIIIDSTYITECKIDNLSSYSPQYRTKIIVSKYKHDMNLIWCNQVNDDGYYYPRFIVPTKDNGYLIGGFSNDENNYSRQYLYVVKIDNNGTLSIGMDDPFIDEMYSFYPNPANDNINMRFSPGVSCEKIEIFSIDGKICHEQNFNLNTINVNHLVDGVYIMKVILDNGNTYTEKIVVK